MHLWFILALENWLVSYYYIAQSGMAGLMMAASEGHCEVTKLFIKRGANLEAVENVRNTMIDTYLFNHLFICNVWVNFLSWNLCSIIGVMQIFLMMRWWLIVIVYSSLMRSVVLYSVLCYLIQDEDVAYRRNLLAWYSHYYSVTIYHWYWLWSNCFSQERKGAIILTVTSWSSFFCHIW